MASTQTSSEDPTRTASASDVEMKLEVVVLPVSDVDRAKRFYTGLGWRLDADFTSGDFRAVQVTPPGSQCSVHFGKGLTPAAPGSVQGLFLAVFDMEAARAALIGRGVAVSEAFHYAGIRGPRVSGPDPEGRSYFTYASFSDPDGNGWLLQEIKTRLPGRVSPAPGAAEGPRDVATLTELLRQAEKRHGEYEPTAPKHHWSGWYAAYIVARERGRAPDEAAKDAALHMEGARR